MATPASISPVTKPDSDKPKERAAKVAEAHRGAAKATVTRWGSEA